MSYGASLTPIFDQQTQSLSAAGESCYCQGMRTLILAIVVVAGCKGNKDKEQKEAAQAALVAPKVEVSTVLAKDSGRMPWLLVVEDAGARVIAAESWAAFDAGELKIMKERVPLDHLDRYIREDFAMGKTPLDTVANFNEMADSPDKGVEIDLASLEDTTTRTKNLAQDDPPPPEEEDKPDDGADESGGTGTAMALEEGKMGKKDSERAEGQYKMQKNQEDPQLARQQAIEQARNAGILGNLKSGGGSFGFGMRANEDGTPSRVSQVQGLVIEDGTLDPFRSLILIAPTAKATKLIDAIGITGGAIAVSHNGKVRPLRLQFMIRDGSNAGSRYWLEARVQAKGLVVEAVPDAPIEVSDLKGLAAALDKAREARGADADAPVDVLVDADVDAQRMIDVIVALDVAGVRGIGLGPKPDAEELSRRGKRVPTVSLGQPNAQGDLSKAIIRRYINMSKPQIASCIRFDVRRDGARSRSPRRDVRAGGVRREEWPRSRAGSGDGGCDLRHRHVFSRPHPPGVA